MKKLVEINTVTNTGSTGRIAEQIGILANSRGFDSYIAYGIKDNNSQLKKIKISSKFDFYNHCVQSRLLDNHGFASKNATENFIKKLKLLKPDIIHLHNIHGYYLNIVLLFGYLKEIEIPVVWTLHDCWPLTGHCSYFDAVECSRWKTGCFNCPNKKGYPTSVWLDRSMRNFELKKNTFLHLKNLTFVVPSLWLQEIVKDSFLKNYPTKLIYNGVDIENFKPQENPSNILKKYHLEDKYIILGVASVWDKRKGLDDFIKLSALLGNNERIVLVGLTEKQQRLLPYNVIGIDRTENIQELVSLYSAADVFLNPTWVDNFPTTNLEALACGTPVITYDTGGSPEAVDEETGCVVKKGDIEGLSKAVKHIQMMDRKLIRSDCRKKAMALFDKNKQFDKYIDLFTTFLK